MPLIFVMHFPDIGQCYRPVQKITSKIKNSATLGTTRIIYHTFSKYSRPLHKLGKLEAAHRVQKIDRIPELPTDISQICLIRVYIYGPICLEPFFRQSQKMSTFKEKRFLCFSLLNKDNDLFYPFAVTHVLFNFFCVLQAIS